LRGEAGGIGIVCCAMPVGIILFILFSFFSTIVTTFAMMIYTSIANIFVDKKNKVIADRKAPNPESFIFKEDIIQKRKSELSNREQKVNGVLTKAKLNTDEKWKQVCVALENSIKTLKRQEAKYNLKGIEIKMVRLQNELAPFVYETKGFSYDAMTTNLKIVERAESTANGFASQINNQLSILDNDSEAKELNQRLDEIQEALQHKIKALVKGRDKESNSAAKQAINAEITKLFAQYERLKL
jgi:hypothetical protein